MTDRICNDNDLARAAGDHLDPDAHGRAAMLLVESLIHGLVARSLISVSDAVEIVTVAADVMEAIADDLPDSFGNLKTSVTLLTSIGSSLSFDLPEGSA